MKQNLQTYFNTPFQFLTNSRLRVASEASKRIYVQVTYEILRSNHDPYCRKYAWNSYAGSYDQCKESDLEIKIKTKFNCSVPFVGTKPGTLCHGSVAKKASKEFQKYFQTQSENCPHPCLNMLTYFGIPTYTNTTNGIGRAQFYFNTNVKVTDDFVSYDLLR